jgi:hypothetical protein
MGNFTPAKRALAAIDAPPSDVAEAPKRISKKIRAAIDAMVAGEAKTITEAAAVAGCSREHLSRELGKPHVNELLRGKVLRNLALASARAGDTKVKLLDSPNELVRDRASSFILGLAGISPEAAPTAPRTGLVAGLQIVIVDRSGAETVAAGPQSVTIDHEPALVRSDA